MFQVTVKNYLFLAFFTALMLISSYTFYSSVRIHMQSINFPYQLEFREGAALPVTDLYVKSENPFDLEYQPQYTYMYGFVYPLVVSPFAKVFGNTLSVHRWFVYVSILLTCILIFIALRFMKVNIVLSFVAAVILHQSLVYHGLTSTARPEGLGILLYVLGILIPWHFKFSRLSCLASIILGIAGYLTKPYYLLVIPFLMIYLFFFVSRRKAIYYGITSFVLITLTAVIVNLVYESFYNNTFFTYINYSNYEFDHLISQMLSYLKVNVIPILIIIISSVWTFGIFSKSPKSFKGIYDNFLKMCTHLKGKKIFADEPVLKTKSDLLFSFVLFFSVLLFILKFGGHTGNYKGAYLFHLASPFLVLTTFQIINSNKNSYYRTLIAAMLIASLLLQYKSVSFKLNRYIDGIRKTEEVIAKSTNILNSSEYVSMILQQNKQIYNTGHTEYFGFGVGWLSDYLGISEDIQKRNDEYKNEIYNKISNREFDMILISESLKNYDFLYIDRENLVKNYECSDTLTGYFGRNQVWYPVK